MRIFKYLVMPPLIALFIFFTTTYIIYQLVSVAPRNPSPALEAAAPAPVVGYTEWLFGGTFSRGVVNGDFGLSFRTSEPAFDVFQERLPASMELFTLTLLGSLILGIPIGTLMAFARRWLTDGFIRPFAWLGASMPVFWVAIMLILIFAMQQRTFPASGRCGVGAADCAADVQHLTLPILTLWIAWIPVVALYVRGAILRTYKKAEDLSVGRRALYGILLPVLGILPVFFAGIYSHLLLIEAVFAWPGVGRLAMEAAITRDLPLLTAAVFIPVMRITLSFLVLGLISGLIALLAGELEGEGQSQPAAPEQPPVQEPVGLFAEEATPARVWIDRIYTLLAIIAAVILVGITVVTFSPSIVTDADPLDSNPIDRLQPPDPETHPLGTDALGRDVQARLLYGGQTTLQIAFQAALIAIIIGGVVGFVGGLFMDSVGVVLNIPIQVVVMALNLLPTLPFLALAVGIFTPQPDTIALLLALLGWGSSVIVVRTKVAQFFNPNARSGSLASWLFLPVYLFAANLTFFILAQISLDFLGAGLQPPAQSWGLLLADTRSYLAQADYLVIAPGLLITLTVFCLFLVASRLRDAFDYD